MRMTKWKVTAGAVASVVTGIGQDCVAAPPHLRPGDYFLSASNPLATADQRDLEAKALEIIRAPAVQQAKENARARWKTIIQSLNPDAEAWARFDAFIDEFTLHYVLKALNSDPNYPRIVRVNTLSHRWFGRSVPGTRQGAGDNMDNTYALIPIAHGARYEISVQQFDPHPADVTWSLMGDLMPTMTLAVLEGRQMAAGRDGRFTVILDAAPANGRVNYMQTKRDARFLFIRETRSDWRQVPAAIRVKRITKPDLPPLTDEELVARAARYVVAEIPNSYWWNAILASKAVNEMTEPVGITTLGGLVTQQVSFGRAHLSENDALLVTVNAAGAAYHSLAIYDFWFNTLDYANFSTSLNNGQAVPDADGSTTYVVSLRDPGVYNWIDPMGLHSLLLVYRWQGLPSNARPGMSSRLVQFSALNSTLPVGTRRVTAEERLHMLDQRRAEYALRFAE